MIMMILMMMIYKRNLNVMKQFNSYPILEFLSPRLLSKNIKIRIYRTIILPVVLYWCETSSLTLRKEHRLRVSENRVLGNTFGPKRDEVTGGWRKPHDKNLHNL
jgi:hypothetical protein